MIEASPPVDNAGNWLAVVSTLLLVCLTSKPDNGQIQGHAT